MPSIAIRQSGGANIVSLPKAIVQTLGLEVGSRLDLSIKDNQIILTPVNEDVTLESLLEDSPKSCFEMTEEDKAWESESPIGKEL